MCDFIKLAAIAFVFIIPLIYVTTFALLEKYLNK